MPDFKVAVRTAINLLTGPFLLTGTSSVVDDEGGNGSRRVSPSVLAALLQARRRQPVYVASVTDEDEPLAVLRAMGML